MIFWHIADLLKKLTNSFTSTLAGSDILYAGGWSLWRQLNFYLPYSSIFMNFWHRMTLIWFFFSLNFSLDLSEIWKIIKDVKTSVFENKFFQRNNFFFKNFDFNNCSYKKIWFVVIRNLPSWPKNMQLGHQFLISHFYGLWSLQRPTGSVKIKFNIIRPRMFLTAYIY